MRRYLPLVALFAVACTEAPTDVPADLQPQFAAGGARSGGSATGSGHITLGDTHRTFTFTAGLDADGAASGRFLLKYSPGDIRIGGDVTCMSIVGNTAYLGGVVTNASDATWIGGETAFTVQDNGEGAGAVDMISLMPVPAQVPGRAQLYCDQQVLAPDRAVEGGNVQVR